MLAYVNEYMFQNTSHIQSSRIMAYRCRPLQVV